MTLTLNIPPELEQYLWQEAKQKELSIEAVALQFLIDSIRSKQQQALATTPNENDHSIKPIEVPKTDQRLLEQLAVTEAVVWSPLAGPEAVQALSDMLAASKRSER
jgi:hypothetical protein